MKMLLILFLFISSYHCKVKGYCYSTEKECKDWNKEDLTEYYEGSCVSEIFGQSSLVCTSLDSARVYSECNDDCSSCSVSVEIGGCRESSIVTNEGRNEVLNKFCHIECSMGYISQGFIAIGSGMMGIGCLFCLCCFWLIFCPIGFLFIMIGICCGCC